MFNGNAFASDLQARDVVLVHADEAGEFALGVALGLAGGFESGWKNVHIVRFRVSTTLFFSVVASAYNQLCLTAICDMRNDCKSLQNVLKTSGGWDVINTEARRNARISHVGVAKLVGVRQRVISRQRIAADR
jgi:hypothetical protein